MFIGVDCRHPEAILTPDARRLVSAAGRAGRGRRGKAALTSPSAWPRASQSPKCVRSPLCGCERGVEGLLLSETHCAHSC